MAKKSAVKKKKTASKAVRKKKVVRKKAASKKVAAKKVTTRKVASKKAASKKSAARKTSSKKAGVKKKAVKKKTVRKKIVKAQVSASAATAEEDESLDAPPLTEAQLRKIKTGLSRDDLARFRNMLLERRAEILGDVASMEAARSGGSGGDLSHMPLHMADVGSDAYEQEFTLGLMESERKLVIEIDLALGRLAKKIYGVCLESGLPIPRARLEIKPWAKYTIEVVRERERRGL